jgi:hypothetical protein
MNKKHTFPFIAMLALLLLLSSCEYIFFQPGVDTGASATFEYLWNKVNEQYAFFDVKDVDWESVYLHYEPHIYDGMPDDSLFYYLGNMMNELKDGHVNLISEFNVSRYDITMLGPQNINYRLVKENYLGTDMYITGPFQHNFIANGQVGYIRYASFSDNFTDEQFVFILNRYSDTRGLIIDIRQNGGGYGHNITKLLSHLIHSDQPIYTSAIKSGPDHNDFSEAVPLYSTPYDTTLKYSNPVAVLIDRGSYSATSVFALATLSVDNIFLVGDTTGGGLGMPNGGQLPNGWTYRFSITRTLTANGVNYENGIPPTIHSLLDAGDVARGWDTVIETALDTLLAR